MSERSRQYRQVIGFFWPRHDMGHTPSGFIEQLIRAACKADGENRDRLYRAFPHVVDAVFLAQTADNALASLVSIIKHDEEGPL